MKLEVGMYVRLQEFDYTIIAKIVELDKEYDGFKADNDMYYINQNILKSSHNIIDLIEYMDLLEIENPIKLYDKNIEVSLFNPVRCDGFTEFEDGTHCIILNMDYLVDIKDLKIKSVLTKEQFESMKYEVSEK